MTEPQDLSPVIAGGLCIACGACVAADRSIQLALDPEKLMFEPTGPGGEAAASVCPAIEVDFAWLQEQVFAGSAPTAIGAVEKIALAQSADRGRNDRASSGGMIKELLRELMSRDDVDGVIALTHTEGLTYEPTLVSDPERIDRLPGSIYHNISFEKALRILEDNAGRFVLVAIPCQLEGIYNYIYKLRPDLAERIHTTIGLICGWTYTHHALRAICDYKGLDFDAIEDVSYRGGGPVGPLRFGFAGRTSEIDRRDDFDYKTAFDRSFNVPRCHLCVNHINVLAEYVVGDAWLSRTATSETGVSVVIARTARAAATLEAMEAAGKIRLAPADEGAIVESQSRRFTYGDFAYPYADYLRQRRELAPKMEAPNRTAMQPVSRSEIETFHRETLRKISIQRAGRYRSFRRRKLRKDWKKYFFLFLPKWLVAGVRSRVRARRITVLASDELENFR